MAATVQIHEMSALATGTDKTSGTVRFKAADNATVDTADRLTVPTSGTNYSYTKQLRANVTVAPDVDLQDLEAYSDHSDGTSGFGTGVGVQYDVSGTFAANINTNIDGTDLFTKDSGDPIDMDGTNTGPHTGTGYQGDLLRLQMTVADTASQGQLTPETLTFSYTET